MLTSPQPLASPRKNRAFFAPRVRALLFAAAVGATAGALPRAQDVRAANEEGLQAALEELATASVSGVQWEPSRGVLADWLWGRPLLFQVRSSANQTDIARAFVRRSPDGQLLGAHSLRLLSRTESANEEGLRVRGAFALYAVTTPYLSLTVLERRSTVRSFQAAVRAWLTDGDPAGFHRSHIHFRTPPELLTIRERGLEQIEITSPDWPEPLVLSLSSGTFADSDPESLPRALIEREPERDTPFLHFAVDVTRSIVGPEPIARLEELVFGAQDVLQQVSYRLRGGATKTAPAAPHAEPKVTSSNPKLAASQISAFPPEATTLDWRRVDHDFLPRIGGGAPFAIAHVLPDPARPYVRAELVAMDMRYLELGIRAGYREPEPETGPPGSGHVPEDLRELKRIVATFNGGFQSVHGRFGMRAEGRLLVRPSTGLATVGVTVDDEVLLGTLESLEDAEQFVAFRQNLVPLLDAGVWNPTNAQYFGEHALSSGTITERSGLCVHPEGHLIYGWAREIDAKGLAEAFRLAGCDYAMHLDMNPGHCSFSFHRVESIEPVRSRSTLLTPRMRANPERFLRWSPQDFFYVARRASGPNGPELDFNVPEPLIELDPDRSWLWQKKLTLGSVQAELELVELRDVHLSLQSGTDETRLPVEAPNARGVTAAWGLGHATHGSRPGLALGNRWLVSAHRGYATLVLPQEGTPELLLPGIPRVSNTTLDQVQLVLLARDHKLLDAAREIGGLRWRGALCFISPKKLLLGRLLHDSVAPLVEKMLATGCAHIASMDRGSHQGATLELRAEIGARAESLLILEPSPPVAVAKKLTSSSLDGAL